MDRAGRVTCGSTVLAERVGWVGWGVGRVIGTVRERTPVDWWRRAAEIVDAGIVDGADSPLGPGVDFFCYDLDLAAPDDVREAIAEDAYEAAREVIVGGLHEHERRMALALAGFPTRGGEG